MLMHTFNFTDLHPHRITHLCIYIAAIQMRCASYVYYMCAIHIMSFVHITTSTAFLLDIAIKYFLEQLEAVSVVAMIPLITIIPDTTVQACVSVFKYVCVYMCLCTCVCVCTGKYILYIAIGFTVYGCAQSVLGNQCGLDANHPQHKQFGHLLHEALLQLIRIQKIPPAGCSRLNRVLLTEHMGKSIQTFMINFVFLYTKKHVYMGQA